MKITIAYIDGEDREATLIQRFAKRLVEDVEVVTSRRMDGLCNGRFQGGVEVAVPCEEGSGGRDG